MGGADGEPQCPSLVHLATIHTGEYIALYQNQRAVLKARHLEKEEYISRLAQDKEEMKVSLALCVQAPASLRWVLSCAPLSAGQAARASGAGAEACE